MIFVKMSYEIVIFLQYYYYFKYGFKKYEMDALTIRVLKIIYKDRKREMYP